MMKYIYKKYKSAEVNVNEEVYKQESIKQGK